MISETLGSVTKMDLHAILGIIENSGTILYLVRVV